MKVSNSKGASVTYPNESIRTISFPKACEVFNLEDCAGNNIHPDAIVMYISFKDGTSATLEAHNWQITEV